MNILLTHGTVVSLKFLAMAIIENEILREAGEGLVILLSINTGVKPVTAKAGKEDKTVFAGTVGAAGADFFGGCPLSSCKIYRIASELVPFGRADNIIGLQSVRRSQCDSFQRQWIDM